MVSLSAELHLDRPFEDLRNEALLSLVHTANQIGLAGASFFRRFDMTEAQFNVLFALKYKEIDVTQSELGKRLVVTRASITSVLDKLEEKGLVERRSVPGDRRIYYVELTPRGKKLVDQVEPLYRKEVHAALGDFGEKELRTLVGYLERIRANTITLRGNQQEA
jgi:DNA-binding MarR family transcriptional regulator